MVRLFAGVEAGDDRNTPRNRVENKAIHIIKERSHVCSNHRERDLMGTIDDLRGRQENQASLELQGLFTLSGREGENGADPGSVLPLDRFLFQVCS